MRSAVTVQRPLRTAKGHVHDVPERPALPPDPRADERPGPGAAGDGRADDRSPRPRVRRAGPARAGRARRGCAAPPGRSRCIPRPAPAPGRPRWSTRCRPATACSPSIPGISPPCGADGRRSWGWTSTSCPATGGGASIRARCTSGCPRTAATRSRRSWSFRTRPPPGLPARSRAIRAAMDSAGHPALLMVDTISSLGSVDYRHDEWGVDVTIWCSQKGMMLPPGLGVNAVSAKALGRRLARPAASELLGLAAHAGGRRDGPVPLHARDQPAVRAPRGAGHLDEEGLAAVFARHARHAEATRRAVRGWGLDIVCQDPREYSSTLTAVLVPDGHRRGPGAPADSRALQHVPRRRAGPAGRTGVPHRAPRGPWRPQAGWGVVRGGDGTGRRRACPSPATASAPRSTTWGSA